MISHLFRLTGALGCVLLFQLAALAAPADNARVLTGERPAWFEPATLDLAAESRQPNNPEASNSGIEFILFDRQIDLATQATSSHIAYRVTAQAGLSEAAQISDTFDPSYESLEYHTVRVWRDGQPQDRLAAADFKIIQQERDLDRQLFNGTLSAVLLLRDVRVGDIIEYARTRRGANPVFAGKFIETESMGWASPLRHQRLRVKVPAGRTVFSRLHGQPAFAFTEQRQPDGSHELRWEARQLAPLEADAEVPSWFVQYPYLELSEFRDWPEVTTWASSLYDFKRAASEAVRAKARSLTENLAKPEDRALALLDFVQREIRYLGIELGPNSHQPHFPEEVLERRFGDCKDKVFLLCALLEEIGIAAQPVLVNTYQTHTIHERLPSPYAFNHVIARIQLGGTNYIVDPTREYQRGSLAMRGPSEETKGLLIGRPGSAGSPPFTIALEPLAAPRLEVRQTYTITDYVQPATLHASYIVTGSSAESMRYYLANETRDGITRGYLDNLKRSHPNVTLTTPIAWTDDEAANRIELKLGVTVTGLWKQLDGGDRYQAEFYPWSLHRYVLQPETLTRQSPLALEHPVDTHVNLIVKLPDEWILGDENNVVTSPWYKYVATTHYHDRTFEMYYQWKSYADHVTADRLAEHVAKLEEIRGQTGYTLTRNVKIAAFMDEFRLNWISVAVTLIVIAGWVWFAVWINTRPGPAEPPPLVAHQYAGIGGWLILVAINLVVRPFTLLASIVEGGSSYFDARVWATFTSTDYTTYRPLVAVIISSELVINVSMVCWSVVTLILFFRRKRQLPAMLITMLWVTPCLLIADQMIVSALELDTDAAADGETWKEIARAVVGALIWIPYFTVSRRVRATFTQ